MLQRQADQRINPFMKGLSMLTGGIAGEFTGTNEDIRNRNYAKRALMEQDIDALKEERVIARAEAARVQALKDEVEREARQTAAGARKELLEVTGAEEVLTGADTLDQLNKLKKLDAGKLVFKSLQQAKEKLLKRRD